MKHILLLIVILILSMATQAQNLFSNSNLLPWCIVYFDKLQRTPEQRIEMLKQMGIKQYAYDGRTDHIPGLGHEIDLARHNDIDIEGVWLWINSKRDKIGALSEENEQILSIVAQKKLKTTFWLSFNTNFFTGLSHSEKVAKGAEFVNFLASKTEAMGCKIALYNHGDWFGEPENQIEIIKASKANAIGIVYNFHHGHLQINRFPSMLKTMLPYLIAVNLNGMGDTKIMDIGKGEHEKELISELKSSGYKGRIGIIGHNVDEDAEELLKRNIDGLRELGFTN